MARWYIIHAYSGFENKVREAILSEAERKGLAQLVEAVEVPTETITEVKRGKKIQVERKFMPGYVLAKLATQGLEPLPSSPAEFQSFMQAEAARWAQVVKAAGISGGPGRASAASSRPG